MAGLTRCAALRTLMLLGLGLTACAPEILIASSDAGGSPAAGTAGTVGTAGVAGTAGAGGGGGGSEPSEAGQGGEPTTPEPPRLLADSVADFDLVQGKHGWHYGYDDGTSASFTPMTLKAVIRTYEPVAEDPWDCWAIDAVHWTQIFQLGAHANGVNTSMPSMPVFQRAVRRWVSTYSGDVRITGEVAKIDIIPGSNGVEAVVIVDGEERDRYAVGGEDAGGLSYELTVSVNINSTLDFVLDPLDSDDHHDLSRFTAVIERVETPRSP